MVACLHAAALFAANDAARAAMESRSDERSSRAEEKAAGTTPELRKAVAALLVAAARRVNAVNEIAPTEATAAAIGKVAALAIDRTLALVAYALCVAALPSPLNADESLLSSSLVASVESHVMGFACEKSRLSGTKTAVAV